jgi:hypothetical protein
VDLVDNLAERRCGPGGGSGSWSGTWPVARNGSAGTGAAAPAPLTGPTAARSSRSAPSPRSSPGCCWPTSPSEGSSAWTTRRPGTCRRRPPGRPPEGGRSSSPTSPAIPVGCGATPRGCWAVGWVTGTTRMRRCRPRTCTRAWPGRDCAAGSANGPDTRTSAPACWARRWPGRPASPTSSSSGSGSACPWRCTTPSSPRPRSRPRGWPSATRAGAGRWGGSSSPRWPAPGALRSTALDMLRFLAANLDPASTGRPARTHPASPAPAGPGEWTSGSAG